MCTGSQNLVLLTKVTIIVTMPKRMRGVDVSNRPYKRTRSSMPKRGRGFLTGPQSISRFSGGSNSVERKNIDVAANAQPIYAIGAMRLLNGIQQGNTASTIVGRKAQLQSLLLNVTWISAADPAGVIRCLVVYDKSPGGTAPTVSDVLTASGTTQPLNLLNADRFIVLVDERMPVGSAGATGDNGSGSFNRFVKMNLPFVGPSTAGAIAGIETGAVYFVMIDDSVVAVTNHTFSFNSRIRYTDA